MRKLQDGILGHWVLAMAVILVVAALSIPQIDKYMLGVDGPNSLQAAGWVADRAYSPIDVLNAIYTYTPYQGPLYFLLLNQWGYLVGHEIAVGRMLTIYCALLTLAMAYRLGRDAISPLAGNFAVVIMASNAFYSFYIPHFRMYPLLVLMSTFVIWLYLRIAILELAGRRRDYVALVGACAALVSTHVFGLLLYIVLSLHHLLFVRKDKRWLAVCAAAFAGLALVSPHFYILLGRGLDNYNVSPPADIWVTFSAWLNVTTNGSPLLLLLAAAGAVLFWRQNSIAPRHCVVLFTLLLPAVALVTASSSIVKPEFTRYLLAGFPIAVLFQAAGLYSLYRRRKLLGALICLWIVAGLSFAASADWHSYISSRDYSYKLPPWHLVSRTAVRSGVPGHVVAFMMPDQSMWTPVWGPVGLREHWFEDRGIKFRWVGAVKWLEQRVQSYKSSDISPWIVYQESRINDVILDELETTMDELGYGACQRVSLPITTEMLQYRLVSLDCEEARVSISNQVASLRFEFYGAKLAADGSRLYFANKWTHPSHDSLAPLIISHQLISEDWENVAQLDHPLVPLDELRQFFIDVSDVPPGRYRLMAIVYDRDTGKTLDWQEDTGGPSSMLVLQEVIIR